MRYLAVMAAIISVVVLAACLASGPAPVAAPSPGPATPPASAPGPSVSIEIAAEHFTFDKQSITVPAGASVTLVFTNRDSTQHNVAIYSDPSASQVIFKGELINGDKSVSYRFSAPATPGTYRFQCDLHAGRMFGSFIVTGGA